VRGLLGTGYLVRRSFLGKQSAQVKSGDECRAARASHNHKQPMKKKHRGIRMFEGVEVGRSIKEYRDRVMNEVRARVAKAADSHFSKNISLLLAVGLLAHGIYA